MAENSEHGYGSAEDNGRTRGSAGRESDGDSERGGRASNGGGKSNRGFASMSPERQREIASKGGRAAHEKGTAHEWTPDEARRAGRKGGETVSRDRAHMAAIGREGGGARSARRNTPAGGNQTIQQGGSEQGGRMEREVTRQRDTE